MQVIDDQHQLVVEGEAPQQRRHRVEELEARLFGVRRIRTGLLKGQPESLANLRDYRRDEPDVGSQPFDVAGEMRSRGTAADDLNQRPVGRGAGSLPASSPDHHGAAAAAMVENSSASRVLPMPGSPLSRNSRPWPEIASVKPASSSASSRSRPMKDFCEESRSSCAPRSCVPSKSADRCLRPYRRGRKLQNEKHPGGGRLSSPVRKACRPGATPETIDLCVAPERRYRSASRDRGRRRRGATLRGGGSAVVTDGVVLLSGRGAWFLGEGQVLGEARLLDRRGCSHAGRIPRGTGDGDALRRVLRAVRLSRRAHSAAWRLRRASGVGSRTRRASSRHRRPRSRRRRASSHRPP